MKVGDIITVEIQQLNNEGLGVAYYLDHKILVPYSLPKEQLVIVISNVGNKYCLGKILEIKNFSNDRQQPSCIHFTQCGGCSLQHMRVDSYREYKNSLFSTILQQNEIVIGEIRSPIFLERGTRRRVTFHVKKQKIGFFSYNSHDLVKIEQCSVILPQIQDLIPKLNDMIIKISQVKSISLTVIDGLVEINFNVEKEINLSVRQILVVFANKQNIARVCYQIQDGEPEIIFQTQPLKYWSVEIPPYSFVQATDKALEQINSDILNEVHGTRKVADLYCGCGTYSLPIQNIVKVDSFEGNKKMIEAVRKFGLNNLNAQVRDLYKYPLLPTELNLYDLVIINPPRKGAAPQIINLSKTKVPKIIMVSCNLESFIRDAKILCSHSYKITWARVIDQFLWTAHLECIACFELA